jgi:uncharacterized protein YbjT (DUF2867 family)
MDVLVVGGHGKVGLRLSKLLAERGDSPRGVIRDRGQVAAVEAAGAEPIVLDVEEEELTDVAAGADAVVFAAGAGAGGGPERKQTVDFGGAVKLINAAKANDIRRYVIVSAMGVPHPDRWPEEMRPYYEAKAAADKRLIESGLNYTIVRPGRLTDDDGTGKVEAGENLDYGSIPRDDVALVIAECLIAQNTADKGFDLIGGEKPVADAVRAL